MVNTILQFISWIRVISAVAKLLVRLWKKRFIRNFSLWCLNYCGFSISYVNYIRKKCITLKTKCVTLKTNQSEKTNYLAFAIIFKKCCIVYFPFSVWWYFSYVYVAERKMNCYCVIYLLPSFMQKIKVYQNYQNFPPKERGPGWYRLPFLLNYRHVTG